MTPPLRPPLVPLLLLYLVPFVAAAVTGQSAFLGPQGDLARYHAIGSAVLEGAVPYSDVALEYPPFALIPMVLPMVLWPFGPPDVATYAWLFAGFQAFLVLGVGLVVARVVALGGTWGFAPAEAAVDLARRQRAVAWRLVALVAGAALAVTWRFDLFPTLLALVAVWAALARWPVVAGAAIGAGILAKLFPLFVAPAVALAWLLPLDRARLATFVASTGAVGVVGMLPFVATAGLAAFSFVGYQADRGLQIESVGGGLVLLSGLLTGDAVALEAPFSAWEVTGPIAEALLAGTSVALVLGLGALALLGWRLARDQVATWGSVPPMTIVMLATAAILVLVVTSKVFSIQYVVWLLPFAALLPWRQFWLAAAAVALTMPIHPVLYEALVRQEAMPVLLLNLRNALLTALLAWVAWDVARPARLELTTFRSAT